MNSFTYYSPTKYIFGLDSHNKLGEELKKLKKKKILIVYSSSSKKNGLIDRVEKILDENMISYVEYSGVKTNPTTDMAYECIDLARKNDVDFILAVGGGSAIDLAKSVAVGLCCNSDVWDFYLGKEIEKAVEIGVILTIASSGSESSPNAILTNNDTLEKMAIESDLIRPVFAIMNPELTMTLTSYQTACGITDIIAHCLERYFTNTENVDLTDRLLESIIKSVIKEGKKAVFCKDDVESRKNIMWAGSLAHNNIIGCDREQDWNSHHLEHVLSAKYNCNHGAGMAVIFPAWMRYVVKKHKVERFTQFANRVFDIEINIDNPIETAMMGIEKFEDFLEEIKMPLNFVQLGISDYDIEELVKLNNLNGGKTSGFYALNEDDIREIYKIASENRL